jgi:hypothetical protein
LGQEKNDLYEAASRIEQIHANLTALLEVFAPFASDDFFSIHRDLLTSIPVNLRPLISCGVHSSAMTSVMGILKAVEKTLGAPPHILYGENTYFEIIRVLEMLPNATFISEAGEGDWKSIDLIIAQFNPALRRIDFQITEYKIEKISEVLRRTIDARNGKPVTLALDCTFDFIDSSRVGNLLAEFQKEIANGALNIICYRSGVKFNLFGMDNYSGAPFYMIHNQDATWAFFDALLTDPLLQTDRLSYNWFCLAYQNAAPELETYLRQVFDNTRNLLDRVPSRLLANKRSGYRIIPVGKGMDPTFLDIKIFGSFHQLRASIITGFLTVKCMEAKHPLFYRASVGFYHPNLTVLFAKDCTTIRLTLGLDPAQVDVLVDCFTSIDALNSS